MNITVIRRMVAQIEIKKSPCCQEMLKAIKEEKAIFVSRENGEVFIYGHPLPALRHCPWCGSAIVVEEEKK